MRQTTTAQTSHLNVACLIFLSKADLYGYLPVRDCVIFDFPTHLSDFEPIDITHGLSHFGDSITHGLIA